MFSAPSGIDGRQTPWKPSQPAMKSQEISCDSPPVRKRIFGLPLVFAPLTPKSCTLTSAASRKTWPFAAARASKRSRHDLILRINRDGAAVGEFLEVNAMSAAAETKPDAVVGKPFAFEPLANTRLFEQIDSSLLEQASTHALLDVLPAARLDDNRLDALQVKKMGQQEARWPGADDSDLCARFQRSACLARTGLFYIHLAKPVDQTRMLARLLR